MAAIIIQQPSQWNVAYTPNVYAIQTATGVAALGIEINGQIVATLKQNENPAGSAIFDVQKVIQSYLNSHFVETTPFVKKSGGEVVKYRARYGEVNTNGTVTYAGYTADKYVINGYQNWREIDWDETPFRPEAVADICEIFPPVDNATFGQRRWLTNWPIQDTQDSNTYTRQYTIRDNEYHTLSFFNWTDNRTFVSNASQPAFVKISFYDDAGVIITDVAYSISESYGLGPRLDCNDNGPWNFSDYQTIGHVGAGPQNIKDAGLWFDCHHYQVEIYSMNECEYDAQGPIVDCGDYGDLLNFLGSRLYAATFYVDNPCTPFEPIRLSFMNQYGMRDYYTFDRRNTFTVDSQRVNYLQTLGTWSSQTLQIPQQGRGLQTFSTGITERMTLSTNWMTDEVSKWLQELFTSPNILIYKEGQWEPAVINTTTYEEKTNTRNRLFQHFIEVQYANPKQVQRG